MGILCSRTRRAKAIYYILEGYSIMSYLIDNLRQKSPPETLEEFNSFVCAMQRHLKVSLPTKVQSHHSLMSIEEYLEAVMNEYGIYDLKDDCNISFDLLLKQTEWLMKSEQFCTKRKSRHLDHLGNLLIRVMRMVHKVEQVT